MENFAETMGKDEKDIHQNANRPDSERGLK